MNRVKELRESMGWNQTELGKKLNVKAAAISKYEKGDVSLTGETLLKLAEIFHVSTDYLLGKTDDIHHFDFNERYSNIIGERLRTVRESRNLSVSDVSKVSNISETEILAIEGGTSNTLVETLFKLAQHYNVSAKYFLGLFDDPAPITTTDKLDLETKWNNFLAQLPEDQAMLFENTDYPDEEKIAIMEEAEKAKQKKLKKIEKFMQYPIEVIDDALIYAAFDAEQRKKMNDEN